jgi:hypothetical protein
MFTIRQKQNISAALCAFFIAACGGGGSSPFADKLRVADLEIPRIVQLSEFTAACRKLSVTSAAEVLDELDIVVRGEGDAAYILGRDLLAACGDKCREDGGLGEVLKILAVPRQENK